MEDIAAPKITVCSEYAKPGWRWIENGLSDSNVRLEIVGSSVRSSNRVVNLERLRLSWMAVRRAITTKSIAIVAHGPTLAAWVALFSRLLRFDSPIIAHSFNFSELPVGIKRKIFSFALRRVDHFVVFSTMERKLYSDYFSIPIGRMEFVLWGVQAPVVDDQEPVATPRAYICAIGGNARDYATLLGAASQTPELNYVLIVRPHSLVGLTVPKNVTIFENLSFGRTMKVLADSRFMVLPLCDSGVACGHVTIVAAMHLGKASVVTNTAGVADYVAHGKNALLVRPGHVLELRQAMVSLWNDDDERRCLGTKARTFARENCSEQRVVDHFKRLLLDCNLRLLIRK